MAELIYNSKTMEWESAKTGQTVESKPKSYTKKYHKVEKPKIEKPKIEKPKIEKPKEENDSDLLKAIDFEMCTSGVIDKSKIAQVDYSISDYEDRRWRPLNNAGQYQGYIMRDGKVVVPDAMIDFIGYQGASKKNWKIGRRGYTEISDSLLNDLMAHNEHESRNKNEGLVRERNLNCVFILAELTS